MLKFLVHLFLDHKIFNFNFFKLTLFSFIDALLHILDHNPFTFKLANFK